jgi:hypothetical protein
MDYLFVIFSSGMLWTEYTEFQVKIIFDWRRHLDYPVVMDSSIIWEMWNLYVEVSKISVYNVTNSD